MRDPAVGAFGVIALVLVLAAEDRRDRVASVGRRSRSRPRSRSLERGSARRTSFRTPAKARGSAPRCPRDRVVSSSSARPSSRSALSLVYPPRRALLSWAFVLVVSAGRRRHRKAAPRRDDRRRSRRERRDRRGLGSGGGAVLTLVLGGARSGKSRHAQSLAARGGRAGALRRDRDAPRIRRWPIGSRVIARIARPHWETIGSSSRRGRGRSRSRRRRPRRLRHDLDIESPLRASRARPQRRARRRFSERSKPWPRLLRERESIAVSNEVGDGIVPETSVAREFRDLQGQANQILAREASRSSWWWREFLLPLKSDG